MSTKELQQHLLLEAKVKKAGRTAKETAQKEIGAVVAAVIKRGVGTSGSAVPGRLRAKPDSRRAFRS